MISKVRTAVAGLTIGLSLALAAVGIAYPKVAAPIIIAYIACIVTLQLIFSRTHR